MDSGRERVVLEQDDAGDLESAVERLAAGRSELVRLAWMRNVIGVATDAALCATVAGCWLSCSLIAGAVVVAAYVGASILALRACLFDVVDEEAGRTAARVELCTREVQERIAHTDQLLAG